MKRWRPAGGRRRFFGTLCDGRQDWLIEHDGEGAITMLPPSEY